jgi:hypothetical protein
LKTKDTDLIGEVLAARTAPRGFDLKSICFPEQLAFIEDPSDWVTGCCSRRAGKTEACAIDLLNTAMTSNNAVCLYITTTRLNAERIIWGKLKNINEKYNLGGKINQAKLSISFPHTNSVIYLCGCKDKNSLDNFLGLAIKLVYIDEVQKFRSFIGELIDDKIGPALADYRGKIKLIGTPSALKSGYFWDTLHNKVWSHHHWTFWNNPFIAASSGLNHQSILDRELNRRQVDVNHPSVQREWFGLWVNDTESLVLHWKPENNFADAPLLTDYVIGVDLGFDDADAISILGWHKNDRVCYLVEEIITAEQGITPLVAQIEKAISKYQPLKVVIDQGGLGKKIAEELRKRYALPIVAAEKTRKVEFLALLDDALRTKQLRAKGTSRFTQDAFVMEWDFDKTTPDKKVVKQDPHSDIIDSVLYAYREALHWLGEPERPKQNIKDPAVWAKHTQDLMDKNLQRQIDAQEAETNENLYYAMQELDNPQDVAKYFVNRRKQ